MDNRFYEIDNPKDRQYITLTINLDDISSVEYPNESLQVGKLITKTGKEYFIQKDEILKIKDYLNIVNIVSDWRKSHDEKIDKILDRLYETEKYFPGKETIERQTLIETQT